MSHTSWKVPVRVHAAERSEDVDVGADDYDDVVEDVDGAMYADASELCYFLSTTDVGGQLWSGGVDTDCVTVVDG